MKSLMLPRKFSSVFGKNLLLATSSRKREPCLILLEPEKAKKVNSSDVAFWGGVQITEKGRIIIPPQIRKKVFEHFKIKRDEKLVFIGLLDSIEIWREKDWEKYQKTRNREKILEKFLGG